MLKTFASLHAELKDLIAINATTDAYITACEWLIRERGADLEYILGLFKGVAAEQARVGYLSPELGIKRDRYRKIMLIEASGLLPGFDYMSLRQVI